MSARIRHALPFVVGLVLFFGALEVLRLELRAVTWHDLSTDILNTPRWRLALAFLLTALNYLALTGYDLLAFAYINNPLSRARVVLASFLAYAISNNVGFAMLSGASVRYRFYSRWGVTAEELSRIVVSYSVTFWLGLLLLGGISLAAGPRLFAGTWSPSALLVTIGWLLILVAPAYLAGVLWWRRPIHVRSFILPVPSWRIAAGQVLVSSVEWALAGAVLYVLLPDSGLRFVLFLGAFLVAILIGMISHVPGGVGVFEGLLVLLLKPYLSSGQLLPALVVYRAVYYLLPLTVAAVVLVADELWQRRHHVARAGAILGRLTDELTPKVLAILAFLAGMILLFSGATPAAAGRLELLDRFLPLGVIEASHFLGSIAGAALLILSQGLSRRLDAAYYLTTLTILVGVGASLLKGLDYEEALVLLAMLAVLLRTRGSFDRRAAFFDTRFSPRWAAAVAIALGASAWLALFAFKHVDYSQQLWWQFELAGEASRALRAGVGAAIVLLVFALSRLLTHARHEAPPPTAHDLDDAARIIAGQSTTSPFLVFLRDKAILFNDDRSAFIMYGVQGRTWVALGDPVGPEASTPGLIRSFLERCDDYGAEPAFYEVGKARLHRYADFGMTFVKLGEEAKVDLTALSFAGGQGARYRQAFRKLEKEGSTFRVVEAEEVPAILGALRAVSDDWLAAKTSAEKGFSLGFFDDEYLSRFPVGVVEHDGKIVAFANLWRAANHEELSIDLMRYHHDASKGIMEALTVHIIRWGKEQGYRWFSLGMAPLSGFEDSPIASLWSRLGGFFYEHGDTVYHFQGLRAYKEKFGPVWEPRYLAYPGGLRLPRIMADVTALIAGGYRQIFRK